MKVSIIYPFKNEMESSVFLKNLISFKTLGSQFEVLFVGASSDGTSELISSYGYTPIPFSDPSRAKKMNHALKSSCGDVILFHHPRSFVDRLGLLQLTKLRADQMWGGFVHRFDQKSLGLLFTSWYSNKVRAKIKEIFYLDHCIFVQRTMGDLCFDEVEIFEDTLISQKFSKRYQAHLLNFYSTTSAIRFHQNGFWKQSFKNQILKLAFLLNIDHKDMNKFYEKGLFLN